MLHMRALFGYLKNDDWRQINLFFWLDNIVLSNSHCLWYFAVHSTEMQNQCPVLRVHYDLDFEEIKFHWKMAFDL